jgi:hypothetical protein
MFCGHPAPDSRVDNLVQLIMAAGAEFASVGTPFPRYPRSSLLLAVDVPVRVLLAGNTIHYSAEGVEHIQDVVPSWTYRLWPEASHALPCEAPDEVSSCIREFVNHVT